jgi:hypothetical protein
MDLKQKFIDSAKFSNFKTLEEIKEKIKTFMLSTTYNENYEDWTQRVENGVEIHHIQVFKYILEVNEEEEEEPETNKNPLFKVSIYTETVTIRYGGTLWNQFEFCLEALTEHLDPDKNEYEVNEGEGYDEPDNEEDEEEEEDNIPWPSSQEDKQNEVSVPPTYKFRCECPFDYDRIQAACGEGMNEAKVIPQFINEILPIPDIEVEFKSTLSYEQLLRKFDGVADAHIAFQTLMPIEEYTGERDYDRTLAI